MYVLSSKSENPEIASLDNAFKIGFTRGTVADRVAQAEHDPTFLYAPVTVERDYRIYNTRPSAIEHLLHRVFAPVRLDIAAPGSSAPSEWFIVPIETIDKAIDVIASGEITEFIYDKTTGTLTQQA